MTINVTTILAGIFSAMLISALAPELRPDDFRWWLAVLSLSALIGVIRFEIKGERIG